MHEIINSLRTLRPPSLMGQTGVDEKEALLERILSNPPSVAAHPRAADFPEGRPGGL